MHDYSSMCDWLSYNCGIGNWYPILYDDGMHIEVVWGDVAGNMNCFCLKWSEDRLFKIDETYPHKAWILYGRPKGGLYKNVTDNPHIIINTKHKFSKTNASKFLKSIIELRDAYLEKAEMHLQGK